ncbi:CvfB family protein [Heyndrickxia acidiproducens]|uniref:CvfB family protein n=1 Tax=Heyndrickxia acidiproducens TaxID=1121084 RepID=UPI00036ECF71|nr:S1-like domain-containing RNA-binding protein [Heyndrickxia acidiproducens]
MALQAGTVAELRVEREAPFGYFLTNGTEEVLLHHREITEGFDPEGMQTVFLYQDHQGRLAATMTIPEIQLGTYGWAEVAGAERKLGVFVSIGISKDILISVDDLPALLSLWPEKGDHLYITLELDKHGRLFGKLAPENIVKSIAKKAARDLLNQDVLGYAYRLLKAGTFMFTDGGYIGYIHESQRKKEPRLGQRVEGRVIDVKENGTIYVSLLPRAYEEIGRDAEQILAYMDSRGGKMPYWDKSTPEEIEARFNISKAAFKRALGRLIKNGEIYQEAGWTYRKNGED